MAHSIDRNREVEVRRWRHWERRESLTKETEREVELGKQRQLTRETTVYRGKGTGERRETQKRQRQRHIGEKAKGKQGELTKERESYIRVEVLQKHRDS